MRLGTKVVVIVEDGPRAVFKGLTGTIIKDEGWGSREIRFENPGRQISFPEGEFIAASRDPARIKRILKRIEDHWTKFPDLRLGQLLCNHAPSFENNPYNYEDDDLEVCLKGYQVPKDEKETS